MPNPSGPPNFEDTILSRMKLVDCPAIWQNVTAVIVSKARLINALGRFCENATTNYIIGCRSSEDTNLVAMLFGAQITEVRSDSKIAISDLVEQQRRRFHSAKIHSKVEIA